MVAPEVREDAHVRVSDELRGGTELAGYRIASCWDAAAWASCTSPRIPGCGGPSRSSCSSPALARGRVVPERFLRESELAASIDHPNIVPIYEAGEAEDLLFIAMRYVEGRDLRRRLADGCLEPAVATGIVAQVASALDAAHARGLIHRDVKPSNVLLDSGARPDGTDHAYLADFGLTTGSRTAPAQAEARSSAPSTTSRPSRSPATTSTAEPTSTRWAACSRVPGGQPPFRRESEVAAVFAQLRRSRRRPARAGRSSGPGRPLAKAPREGARPALRTCRELAQAALAAALDEASRRSPTSPPDGRRPERLSEAEAELAGTVIDLRSVRQRRCPVAARPRRHGGRHLPVQGARQLRAGRRRALLRPGAAALRARRPPRRCPPPRHRRALRQRQVIRPARGPPPCPDDDALPGSGRWRQVLLRPGERPMDALRDARGLLRRTISSPPRSPSCPPASRLVLAVDQLEELFTACSSDAERVAFVDALVDAAERHGRAVVVVALRADYTAGPPPIPRWPSCSARTTSWSAPCTRRSCGG